MAAAVSAAFVAGIAGAGPAGADPVVVPVPTDPASAPALPCTATAPLPQLGLTFTLTLTARLAAPASGTAAAHFRITPFGKTEPVVAETTTGGWYGGQYNAQFARDVLEDGKRYQWSVRAEQADGVSEWSSPCGFRTDFTPPPMPAVASTVYPPDGVGLPARTPGEFTFSAGGSPDVVAYEYALNSVIPVGGAASVKAGGADHTATVTLKPNNWGTNVLRVQAVDRAGNRSYETVYSFQAGSSTGPDKPGDFDGDGVPDLLTVQSDGSLSLRVGQAGGGFAAPVPLAGVRLPDPDEPLPPQELLRGLGATRGPYQDIVLVRNGGVDVYRGNGLGGTDGDVYQGRPQEIGDPVAGEHMVSVGDGDGDGKPEVILQSGDRLWYQDNISLWSYEPPVLLADTGWANRTIAAAGDVTGDGVPDLWVRDTVTGSLDLAPGEVDNPAAWADSSKWVQVAAKGWTAAARPLLVSAGDGNGDGRPDLWATNANGGLLLYPTSADGTLGAPTRVGGGWSGVVAVG
ncbi:FG-GAP repeat domain-containing protein [Yinghuangia seranimata]|uniref:FG-GAP repeat domain-containing protein n=1 Tax=Yinghuangia seranimata TaxID=408067 RepID=UPI00248AE685|nr:VCBS repeat-containing protein [Yinghuangia seranimata]MDI2131021.1 VCBS repeat-containing protein [Yinghuangia seranimata]